MIMEEKDFKGLLESKKNSMKGHYTIGVESSDNGSVSIFWNNDFNSDMYELTPGFPTTIHSSVYREQYFSFVSRDKDASSRLDERSPIRIYVNSQIRCNIYIKAVQDNRPIDEEDMNRVYDWKSSIGIEGGIHMMEILPEYPGYCVNCTYYGYIESIQDGNVEILVSINHTGFPMMLKSGPAYPEIIK